jgi:hypothetical protein
LSMGLETSRLELNSVREAADQLANGNIFTKQDSEQQTEEIGMDREKLQKTPVELEANEAGTKAAEAELQSAETPPQSTEQPIEAKENQQAA